MQASQLVRGTHSGALRRCISTSVPGLGQAQAKLRPLPQADHARSPPPGLSKWARPPQASQVQNLPTPGRWARPASEAPRRDIPIPGPSKWSPIQRTPGSRPGGSRFTPSENGPSERRAFDRGPAPHINTGRTENRRLYQERQPGYTSESQPEPRPTRGPAPVPRLADARAATVLPASRTWATTLEVIPEVEERRSAPAGRREEQHKSRGSYRNTMKWQDQDIEPSKPVTPTVKKKAHRTFQPIVKPKDLFIPNLISVVNLARLLGVTLDHLQRTMIKAGLTNVEHDYVLTSEYASLLALEYNRNPVVNDEAAFDIYPPPPPVDVSSLPSRPPVVTIMGHVDHGKTTLLDTLRSASVAKGEAGGITQHIGAFSVAVSSLTTASSTSLPSDATITFLDTPGHAAFSAMRARGARATDIVVLVVAADDGVMPQTKEVIELVKKDEGKVGLVVAINKVDKPGADIDAVQRALLAEGVQLEEFGGDVPSVAVSGLTGKGLDTLVETISAVAELMDLKSEKEGRGVGYVLESRVQKGLGPVATVLLHRGSLTPGAAIISGSTHARIRQMTDSSGKIVKLAHPSSAVTVSGWKDLPKAGDEVIQGANEDEVKRAVANRLRRLDMESVMEDVEAINERRRLDKEKREASLAAAAAGKSEPSGPEAGSTATESGPKELRLIIKADVSGSVEAVVGALEGIGNNLAKVKIVQSGVGDVSESDIAMAKTVGGLVVAFSVSTPRAVMQAASSAGVPVCTSSIIYRLMDDIKGRVIDLLPKIVEKRVTGEATVLQMFEIKLKGKETLKVAGCRASNGLVEKNRKARVIRNGEVIHEGVLETLKHLKKDVTEIRKGMECGISLVKFDDVREGDTVQMYEVVEKPGSL